MKTINYSFIIPHKNSTELLKRCIESIPIREDIQIIIVDDYSDKDIIDLNTFHELNETCIEVYFTKEGKGAGYARNVGLKHAKGEWLLFADADDFYTENISYILEKYSKDKTTDIVYLNAQIYHENGNIQEYHFNTYINNYLLKKAYSEKVLKYGVWTPWTRMVKRKLVEENQLTFEEIPIGNDLLFCLKCSKYAIHFKVENNIIYNYYKPLNGSITDKKYGLHTIDSRVINTIKMNNLYKSTGYIFYGTIIEMLIPLKRLFNNKFEFIKFIISIYRKYNYSFVLDIYYYIKFKIGRKLHII